MNVDELIKKCAAALENAGIGNFRNEARWLVLETLSLPASAIVFKEELDRVQQETVEALLARRCRREPLQYLLGSAPFAELELTVTPAVLIPRCETEILAEHLLGTLPADGTLLDVGCGSGAISLLAAHRRKDISVTALDISCDALEVAKLNAEKLHLSDRVQFLQSDLLSALLPEQKFDAVAANLPYVTFDEYAGLEDEVRCYEPQLALTAADEGMELIFKLIRELPPHLHSGSRVALEMSPHQIPRAEAALYQRGFSRIGSFADQFGKKRFAAAVWE